MLCDNCYLKYYFYMLKIVLVARLSVANSGHTVMAGNSNSLNLTLSMVLMPGFSSQSLKFKIRWTIQCEVYTNLILTQRHHRWGKTEWHKRSPLLSPKQFYAEYSLHPQSIWCHGLLIPVKGLMACRNIVSRPSMLRF